MAYARDGLRDFGRFDLVSAGGLACCSRLRRRRVQRTPVQPPADPLLEQCGWRMGSG